jgi:hypothetical protein
MVSLPRGVIQFPLNSLCKKCGRKKVVCEWHLCYMPKHKNDSRLQSKCGPEVTVQPFERKVLKEDEIHEADAINLLPLLEPMCQRSA